MVDLNLINALQQGNQAPNFREAARQKQIANMLLGSAAKTNSPLIAALTGFFGTQAGMNAAEQTGALQQQLFESEQARKAREEERANKKLALTEKELGFNRDIALKQLAQKDKELGLTAGKINAEINKLNREAASLGALDPEKKLKFENDLRDDYLKQSDDFTKQRDAYGRIQASASEPSAAGDLALIFNYMKILDPGSTVREGEFANAQNAGGIPDRIRATFNKIQRGERLSQAQRDDFLKQSGLIYEKSAQQQNKTRDIFSTLAQKAGVDPSTVAIDLGVVGAQKREFSTVEEAEKANLPKGTEIVINGRRAIVE